jgi:hypothetical protein
MLTHYYESTHFIEAVRNGPGGAYFDGFAQELSEAGYARITARRHVRSAQHLIHWSRRRHSVREFG